MDTAARERQVEERLSTREPGRPVRDDSGAQRRAESSRDVRLDSKPKPDVAPASEETNGKAEASREREPRPMPKLEQAEPDFSEPSRFSALSVDDGDDN